MASTAKLQEKWVAWLHRPFNHHEKKIRTARVFVLETAKQFKLTGSGPEYQEARAAVGYRTLVNKASNNCLFDSKLEALQRLESVFVQTEKQATAKANEAQENLHLITEAIANVEVPAVPVASTQTEA